MNEERYHEHAYCGGHLEYHHRDETVRNGHKLIKHYYICNKCGQLVNCIRFPSYEQMVLRKMLIVDFPEVKRIKQKYGKWHK